jgi:ribonucleoside-diphosphate reductase alpha chain
MGSGKKKREFENCMSGKYEKFSYGDVFKETLNYYNGDLLAASTVAKKYLLRDKEGNFVEKTPDDMHSRLALEFARVEKKMNPSCNEAEYFQRVRKLLQGFKKTSPQGSPMAAIGNPFQLQSASNCFVIPSPIDSIAGVFKTGYEMAEIEKRRGGVGTDLSTLRPIGMQVNNAAIYSTGTPTFADFYSHVTRMIGQAGRNGALMLTASVKHPDAQAFATMKHDLKKVTGANISLLITDEFMEAVEKDTVFVQQWPVDVPVSQAKMVKEIRAKDLWNVIVDSALRTAEPGLLMWDNYCSNLPAHFYPGFETLSTNPCSEIALSGYDSCRLISNNLFGWVQDPMTKNALFDFSSYYEDTRLAQRMSDGLVEIELEIVQKIIDKATEDSEKDLWKKVYAAGFNGRRTGLGTHGFADMLLALGLKYDSEEAKTFTHKVYETHRNASYEESIQMAQERGAFPVWDWKYDQKCAFIQRLPKEMKEKIKKHGRRNISNLTIAPTGSVAIASQSSSGIEPVFRFVYDRFVKITHTDINFPVDRVDATGDKWTKFRVVHPLVKKYFEAQGKECPVKEGRDFTQASDDAHKFLKKHLPEYFVSSEDVDYVKGVELQGVMQSMIDHGISKTINMPKGSTKEQVDAVYMQAWKQGLKGVTVYVDGSRDGVLVTSSDTKKEKAPESTGKPQEASGKETEARPTEIVYNHAPRRPKALFAEIHHIKVKGKDWQVVVGLLNQKPFEVWAGQGLVLPKAGEIEKAEITKVNSKRYSLSMKIRDNGVDEIEDLKEIYDSEDQRIITRSVCRELRHGVPLEFIVRDLADHSGSMMDYAAALSRVLKKYATKPNLLAKTCPQCGGKEFIMIDGCISCNECGMSKCN